MNDNHSRNGIKHLCHKRCGLVVGKPLGITPFGWLVTSLFISELAFSDPQLVSEAKVGILVASLLAGVCGFVALHRTLPREAVEGG